MLHLLQKSTSALTIADACFEDMSVSSGFISILAMSTHDCDAIQYAQKRSLKLDCMLACCVGWSCDDLTISEGRSSSHGTVPITQLDQPIPEQS